MTLGMILIAILSAAIGLYPSRTGIASQYDPGIMPRVLRYQQRHGRAPLDVSDYAGFVAVPSCADVGRTLYIRPIDTQHWERFLAVDCAGPDGAYGWMTRNHILVEIDALTAQRWDTVGYGIEIEVMTSW